MVKNTLRKTFKEEIILCINIQMTESIKPYVIIASVKNYSLKNGETQTKIYDQRPYNQKYYNKTKDTLKESCICDICGGKYQKWNKGHHSKSKKHINEVNKHTVLFYPTPPEMKEQTEIEKEENKDKFVIYRGTKFSNETDA